MWPADSKYSVLDDAEFVCFIMPLDIEFDNLDT